MHHVKQLCIALALLCAGCDPVYEYCATVTRCRGGAPVEGLRVRFDHEGLHDSRTDEMGKTCAGNVGAPEAHSVRIELDEDGYAQLAVTTRSRDLGNSGGRGLDVAICVCEQDDQGCEGGLVSGDADAGRSDGGAR